MNLFTKILQRDLLLAYRHRAELLQPLLFFIIFVSLFPLAIDPDAIILKTIAPGIIWMGALLITMLFLENLFRSDFEDGSLEKFILSSQSLLTIVFAKVTAHWLVASLPLIIITPLLAVLLHLSLHALIIMLLTLLLGTPALSFVGAIGTALTVGLKQGGLLLALIVLPLYVPILIFGASAVTHASTNMPVTSEIAMLAALFVLSFTLAPFAIIGALRISVNN